MIRDKETVKKITQTLNIDTHTFLYESKRLYLENKIKEIKSQRYKIAGKYNITSIIDFENKYKNGELEEFATFDDYKELDRLQYLEKELTNLLSDLKND